MDLSVILPCYNEAQVLRQSVKTIQEFLVKTNFKYEIIIAEDASTDGTDKLAKQLSDESEDIVWLHRDKRIGRGSAVSNAIKKSRGRIAGFLDVDLEVPADHILPLVLAIDRGADVATGIRQLSLKWFDFILKFHKIVSHYGYIWLSKLLLGTNLKDTEVGFKFFNRRRILPVLDEIKDKHWFWDTEIMVRSYFKGYTIKEIPVFFSPKYGRTSKVNLIKDSLSYIKNLIRFRKEVKLLKVKNKQ